MWLNLLTHKFSLWPRIQSINSQRFKCQSEELSVEGGNLGTRNFNSLWVGVGTTSLEIKSEYNICTSWSIYDIRDHKMLKRTGQAR